MKNQILKCYLKNSCCITGKPKLLINVIQKITNYAVLGFFYLIMARDEDVFDSCDTVFSIN